MKSPYVIRVTFPGSLEYVAPLRKLVAEVLIGNNFSQKFAYRSEVIVDEVCSNAVIYGSRTHDASVEFSCYIHDDHIEFEIRDQGGRRSDVDRLKVAVGNPSGSADKNLQLAVPDSPNLGLDIVRMLSEEVNMEIDENNVTTVRVVRKRKQA